MSITLRVFICHASEQHSLAARLADALRGHNHTVFLDRDDLPAGQSFDDRIRKAIERCQLFLFLISPNSIEKSAYTLTELKFVREKWPNPSGRVLPVMAAETPFDAIPSYISNLTILQPEGNLVAEVLAELGRLQKPGKVRRKVLAAASAVVALSLSGAVYAVGMEGIGAVFISVLTTIGITTPRWASLSGNNTVDSLLPGKLYGIEFGATPENITSFPNWTLQSTYELGLTDGTYGLLNMNEYLPHWRSERCVSDTSYIVFFFNSEHLVRVSLRFKNEGMCPNHKSWLTFFSGLVHASLQPLGQATFFRKEGERASMYGESNSNVTIIDVFSKSLPVPLNNDWIRWFEDCSNSQECSGKPRA